jgi:hypothetical protein
MWSAVSEDRMGLLFTIAAAPAVILGSESRGTRDHIFTVWDTRLPQPGGTGRPYLYPPGRGWPSYIPRHRVPFSSPPTTRRATVEVFEPASTGGNSVFKHLSLSLSLMLRPTVSRPLCLGIKHPSGAYDQIFISL